MTTSEQLINSTLIAGGVTTIGLLSLGLRYSFGGAALRLTDYKAYWQLDNFKKDFEKKRCAATHDSLPFLAIKNFSQAFQDAENCRITISKEVIQSNLPSLNLDTSIAGLSAHLDALQNSMGSIAFSSLYQKMQDLIKQEAKYRMFKTPAQIAAHPLHHCKAEQVVIDVLDNAGVIDVAQTVMEGIADMIPDGLLDAAGGFLDLGILSHMRTCFREFSLWNNGKIDLGDALLNGGATITLGVSGMAAGMAVDAMFGGALLGIPTIMGTIGGLISGKARIKSNIEGDQKELSRLGTQIYERQRSAVKKIDQAVRDSLYSYRKVVEQFPDIAADKSLQSLLSSIAGEVNRQAEHVCAGLDEAEQKLENEAPARNWLDKFLAIDRPARQKQLYLEGFVPIKESARSLAAEFTDVAQGKNYNPKQAIAMLINRPEFSDIFDQPSMTNVPETIQSIVQTYKSDFGNWASQCQDVWKGVSDKVQVVTDAERQEVKTLLDRLMPSVNSCQERIRNNFRRLGIASPA